MEEKKFYRITCEGENYEESKNLQSFSFSGSFTPTEFRELVQVIANFVRRGDLPPNQNV